MRNRQKDFEKATEHNRNVIANYSREKLLKIANAVGATFGEEFKYPESLTDKKLRKFVLALSQGM